MIRPRREQRRAVGWNAGPSDTEADEAELRGTAAVAAPYDFDTPPVETVFQAETGQPDEAIPVRLTNPVNVNQLPTRLGSMFSVALGTTAVKVLNEDPRRAAVRIAHGSGTAGWAIGRTQAEAADDNAFRLIGNQGPYVFHFTDELWARRVGGAAGDRLSFAVEQWAL